MCDSHMWALTPTVTWPAGRGTNSERLRRRAAPTTAKPYRFNLLIY